jgi:hypothetical protein
MKRLSLVLSAGSAMAATDLGLPKDLEESLAVAFQNNFISDTY